MNVNANESIDAYHAALKSLTNNAQKAFVIIIVFSRGKTHPNNECHTQ